ncbi:MAG: cell division protein ZapA [Candidatus Zixiibacteriota bacterium]
MDSTGKPLRVNIFGEEYPLRIGDGTDPEYMFRVADYVDRSMRKIADRSPNLSATKVAILAALNITDELFAQRRESERKLTEVETKAHGILEWLEGRLTVETSSES